MTYPPKTDPHVNLEWWIKGRQGDEQETIYAGAGHWEAEVTLAQGQTAAQVCCPVLQLFSVGPHWCSHKQLFKLFEIERGLVSLRHPPSAAIRIQWNPNGWDACADAQPHAHGKLRDTCDSERTDAGVLLLESFKEPLLVHFYRNIGFDAVLLEEDTP